jgi:hypothetical protein
MHPYVFFNQYGIVRRNGRHLDLYNFLHTRKNNIVDCHKKMKNKKNMRNWSNKFHDPHILVHEQKMAWNIIA